MNNAKFWQHLSTLVLVLGVALLSLGQDGCEGEFPEGAEPQVIVGDPEGEATRSVTVAIPQGATGLGAQAFGENPLNVAPNTMVTWVNNDTVPHTVTANTGLFESGPIAPGTSFSFTFTQVGQFEYFCNIHGPISESGTVLVTTGVTPPLPTATPSPTATPVLNPFPVPAPTVQ